MKKTFFFLAALMVSAVMMAQTPTVSASKVTMKYCKTTYGTVVVKTSSFPVDTAGFSFNAEGTYVRKIENSRGCDSVVTFVIQDRKGRLDGEFSVAANHYVQFSKGILQYRASNGIKYPNDGYLKHPTAMGYSSGEFRFASTQYETLGDTYPNRGYEDTTSVAWQDIFARGASGYQTKPSFFSHYCQDMSGTNYDWGVFNAISNGGNQAGVWRCLTMSEWNYMMGLSSPCRVNASQKWAYSNVDGHYGIVILPDSWTKPDGCTWNAQPSTNTYTAQQWKAMEESGAVMIQTTGYYESGNYKSRNDESYYYSADGDLFGIWISRGDLITYPKCNAVYGYVRLVMDVE